MNQNIKKHYYLILDNKVIFSETNLKSFVVLFCERILHRKYSEKDYKPFWRKFQKSTYFHEMINDKKYFFQFEEFNQNNQ